jgi:leucyl aminopeptidase
MKVEAVTTPVEQVAVDLLAVPVHDDGGGLSGAAATLDLALGGLLRGLIDDKEATGKPGSLAVVRAPSGSGVAAKRVALVGVGSANKAIDLRTAASAVARHARGLRAASAAMAVEEPAGTDEVAEGAVLGAYRFDRFKKNRDENPPLEAFQIVGGDEDLARDGALRGEAENQAREHVNLPSNYATPTYLAERARALGERYEHIEVQILDREEAEVRGMGGFLGVARGTDTANGEPPKVIIMRYTPPGAVDGETLGLVGKAITFDTGGISLKPAKGMSDMKYDMAGGAAVIEGVGLIAALGIPLRVVGVVMATENVPSSTATKPGDILTASNGKTIEVINTDAEGRLVLADGLVLARREGATRLVDIATLTGAVVIALGDNYAAAITNDDGWGGEVIAAGAAVGERCWQLPLGTDYHHLHESEAADMMNANEGRTAGTIHGGAFLSEFVEDGVPWTHVDIAGVAWANRQRGPWAKGVATGFGVRLFAKLAERVATMAKAA